jgi:hypothetical protein
MGVCIFFDRFDSLSAIISLKPENEMFERRKRRLNRKTGCFEVVVRARIYLSRRKRGH